MSAIKRLKPTTPGQRLARVVNYREQITQDKPYKPLLYSKSKSAGRNNWGKITVRHIGGGYRKRVRQITTKRDFPKGFKVLTIEYDPNRSAFVCLVSNLYNGKKEYILHTNGLEVGKKYQQESNNLQKGVDYKVGDLPVGAAVSQLELNPGNGAKLVRSAGNYGLITAKEEKWVNVKLPSGEVRKFLRECKCVYGRIGNSQHGSTRKGKAGKKRLSGVRPSVRGKAMNPVDHPHGGGEGGVPVGLKYPKTPTGKHALGVRTRKKRKSSDKMILKRRK
jgi:large subunit ribosomal protein L2